jgi:hypothetical protein
MRTIEEQSGRFVQQPEIVGPGDGCSIICCLFEAERPRSHRSASDRLWTFEENSGADFQMKLWLITTAAAAAAAVTAPGAPPSGTHLHYEIRINGIEDSKLTDTEKLQLACAMSYGISGRVQAQAKADAVLNNYLATLQQTTCVKPKSN